MPGGRPSDYSPELAERICNELAGGLSLRKVCKLEWAPDKRTILRWLAAHEEFRTHYALACEVRADDFFDDIVDIADDGSRDTVLKERPDGSTYEATDHDHINRSKLRVDARKWVLSKMMPKKYGDRVVQEHTGPNGGPVLTDDLSGLTDTQRARRIAFALAKGERAP